MMDTISQIKSKLDIVDVIGSYISLKKSGRNYKANCPFHGEKTPSFMVSSELQMYKCFGCSAGGDIFKFVQEIEGIDFVQALEQLAEKAGVEIENKDFDRNSLKKKTIFEINQVTTNFYQKLLKHPSGINALKYLTEKRKLTKETIEHFQIGYAPKTWNLLWEYLNKKGYATEDLLLAGVIVRKSNGNGYIDKFRDRIIFPLGDITGKVVGFTARALDNTEPKYLNSPETLIFHKHNYLYGLDKAKVSIKTEGIIFVEGQVDVITAHQAGIKNVVASSGTSITPEQLQILRRYSQDLSLCLDSDNAGIRAIYRSIELAEKQDFNIKVIKIPGTYKDLDELINNDVELAKKVTSNPVAIYDFFIADNLKKFDKTSALGKKEIIENLKPLLAKIENKVLFESYIKELSKELDIETKTIESIIKNDKSASVILQKETVNIQTSIKNNLESYFLAMLLKSEIDVIRAYMYNFDPEGWNDKKIINLLEILKESIKEEKSFKIEKYIEKLETTDQNYIKDLYLQEVVSSTKELDEVTTRLNKRDNKGKLVDFIEQLKIAEKQKNQDKINELLKEIEEMKKTLL